jgi:hypothetical protein
VYQIAPKVYQKCTKSVSKVYKKWTKSVPKVYQKCTKSVPKVHQKCTKSVPKVYQKCTKSVPKVYQKCTKSVPKVYQKCTKSVPKIPAKYHPCPPVKRGSRFTIFTKLCTAQQNSVEFTSTEFCPIRSIKMESIGKNSFRPARKPRLSPTASSRTSGFPDIVT